MEQTPLILFRLFSDNSFTLGVLLEEGPGTGGFIIKINA